MSAARAWRAFCMSSAVVLLMVGVGPGPGELGPGLRGYGLEAFCLHHVRVMALCTYPPPLLAALLPRAYSLAVDAVPPVAVDFSVALSAEPHGLVEAYLAAVVVYEGVPVLRVMAVKAPYGFPAVLKVEGVRHDVLVHGERPWRFVLRVRHH